jgi:Domain of unknown function (DUF4340)
MVAETIMRGFKSTLILLVVFLGLLGYIYFYESRRPATPPVEEKPKAFTVQPDKIEELNVKAASGETTRLKKAAAGWEVVEPVSMTAAESEVNGITQGLASLEIQRVVDENPSDLAQFGLAQPKVDVAFRANGQTGLTHLLIGDKTPTGSELYAKTQDQKKVFLISSYLDGTFNRTPFDLRDKAILKFDRDKVTGLEIARPKDALTFAKDGSRWNLDKPIRATADSGTVEGLIGQIQSAQMVALTANDAKELNQYGLDKPSVTTTIVTGDGRTTLQVGKRSSDGGAFYARDAARPLVFTISQALVTDLEKPVSDYRLKDIFEFRPFNATRLELTRDKQTLVFEKSKGADPNAPGTWQAVAPVKKDVDNTKFDGAVTKLSGLRADSFVDLNASTGLKTPVASVVVKFDDGKKEERVAFGKSGSDVYAARGDEAGAAKLDAAAFDSAMNAFNEFK